MRSPVKAAFELTPVQVKLEKILPTKKLAPTVKATKKYCAIASSVEEVGIIEPLVVHRQRGGKFLLLDGHARLEVLKDLKVEETLCIISTDDEGFTYNSKVNHVAPIQANRMILKALQAGVSEARLAKTLNLSRNTVRHSRTLLKGICPEALELLKDKPVAAMAFRVLQKVKPLRQIEMAELMGSSATYSKAYAEALMARTARQHLVEPGNAKRPESARPEDVSRVEAEMHALERDVLLLDESYGRNVVNLTIARGYLKKLLENAKIVKYLAAKYPDLLTEFQRIQEAASLET